MRRLDSTVLISALLGLVTLAVFWNVTQCDFVNYDDPEYVTSNPHVLPGLVWTNMIWALQSGYASNWHPLTWWSHMADCELFGLQPAAHHLVSLGFHILNTLTLFLVLRKMTSQLWRSAAVAALFALHPLHVESVVWISERKDVLSTFFFLLTLASYFEYARRVPSRIAKLDLSPAASEPGGSERYKALVAEARAELNSHKSRKIRAWYYLAALVCFTLGLMSKPMLVTVPFLLLLLDYWPLRRVELRAFLMKPVQSWVLVLEKLPFLILTLVSCVVTFLVQRKGGAVSTSFSLGERLGNALTAYVRYVVKMFWPSDLSVFYPHEQHWKISQVSEAALILIVVTAFALYLARRAPYVVAGWFWFIGTLVPVIGLVQVGSQSMADRYSYIPMIGLFMAGVWGAYDLLSMAAYRGPLLSSVAVIILLSCGLITFRQVNYWRSSKTLFRHALEVTHRNYVAYNSLGLYQAKQGRSADAIDNYRKALEINPLYVNAYNNLGQALVDQRRPQEAIPLYQKALAIAPGNLQSHNNLGVALANIGRISEAIQEYNFVLERKADYAEAHNNLGLALLRSGQREQGVEHIRFAVRLDPRYGAAHSNLGNWFASQRRFDLATVEYQEALRLDPSNARTHNNLANVLAETGVLGEAIDQYRKAIELDADDPEIHYNLGLAYMRVGRSPDATNQFKEALRLDPSHVGARKQLAL
jgi:tetratricopeptide (TPR) repeat protein